MTARCDIASKLSDRRCRPRSGVVCSLGSDITRYADIIGLRLGRGDLRGIGSAKYLSECFLIVQPDQHGILAGRPLAEYDGVARLQRG
jgi:hypothetical protein